MNGREQCGDRRAVCELDSGVGTEKECWAAPTANYSLSRVRAVRKQHLLQRYCFRTPHRFRCLTLFPHSHTTLLSSVLALFLHSRITLPFPRRSMIPTPLSYPRTANLFAHHSSVPALFFCSHTAQPFSMRINQGGETPPLPPDSPFRSHTIAYYSPCSVFHLR